MSTDVQLNNLRTSAWRTAGARFNAARRLRQRETFSSASLALFSAAIIVVSLVQALYAARIDGDLSSGLTALTASFGIFALVISLVEAGAKSGERASRLFLNAENLNDFQKRLEVADVEMYVQYLAEYKVIKDSLGDNHEPVDDKYFVAQHSSAPEFSRHKKDCPWRTAIIYRVASVWHLVAIWLAFAGCLAALCVSMSSGCGL